MSLEYYSRDQKAYELYNLQPPPFPLWLLCLLWVQNLPFLFQNPKKEHENTIVVKNQAEGQEKITTETQRHREF